MRTSQRLALAAIIVGTLVLGSAANAVRCALTLEGAKPDGTGLVLELMGVANSPFAVAGGDASAVRLEGEKLVGKVTVGDASYDLDCAVSPIVAPPGSTGRPQQKVTGKFTGAAGSRALNGAVTGTVERDLFRDGVDLAQPVRQLDLTLQDAVPGGRGLVFRIWSRGQQLGQIWAYETTDPAWALLAHATNPEFYPEFFSCLKWDGDTLTGHAVVGGARSDTTAIDALNAKGTGGGCGASDRTAIIAIEAKVEGNTVAGTYRAAWLPTATRARGVLDAIAKDGLLKFEQLDQKSVIAGKLTGRVLEAEGIGQACPPVAAKAYWPCLNGVDGSSGADYGVKLVMDPSKARIQWKSEELIPGGYYELAVPSPLYFGDIQSGHASPVLWNGRLYVAYFVGVEEPEEYYRNATGPYAPYMKQAFEKGAPQFSRIPMRTWYKKMAKMADQIMVCLDATTGQVLWRTVYPKAEVNCTGFEARVGPMGPNSKAPTHLKPAVGDGRVFMVGTQGRLYALDALTGATIWTSDFMYKAQLGNEFAGSEECPVYADGVVAMSNGTDLTGLDAATGKKLWVSKNACDRRVGAIRWQNGGQTYFITAKGKCLEPKTGKELWQIAGDTLDTMRGWVSSVVDENHLVREGQTTEKKGMVLGYRITPAKVEQIWSVPLADVPRSIIPCVYKGHAYVRGRNGASGLGDTTLCINLETGKVVGQAKGSKSFSSPVVGDGRIFNCDAAVTMYQNADPNDFRDLQPSGLGMVGIGRMKAVLRGVPETIGVYADGRFYVRTGDGIICYDMREADAK